MSEAHSIAGADVERVWRNGEDTATVEMSNGKSHVLDLADVMHDWLRMKKELAGQESVQVVWHRSNTELPEPGQVVLAWYDGRFDLVSRDKRDPKTWWVWNQEATTKTPPTYWRLLPEPPQ